MVEILLMSAKMANQDLLKINPFWNKDCYVIISDPDVTKKFCHSGISIRDVIITSIL